MHALDHWAEYQRACGLSEATVTQRQRIVTALCRHAGVSDPLELTRSQAVTFLSRDLKPWSRVTYWRTLRNWCDFVRDSELDGRTDLLRAVPCPRTPTDAPRPLPDDVVTKLLAATLTTRTRAYIRLGLFAALRAHEIAKIRGEDFDFTAGWLMVRGKGGVLAPVPIHPEVAKVAEGMSEFGWWFPSPSRPDSHVLSANVSQTIAAALLSVGYKGTAHQLRHSAATRLQRQSKDIRLTQALLRHQNVNTTQRYAAVANDELQNAVRRLHWSDSNVVSLFAPRSA